MVSLVHAHYINQGIIENKVLSFNVVDESVLKEQGKIDYHVFKPVLFEFPTYEYFKVGEKVGDCAKMN